MDETSSKIAITIDLSEPWIAPARLLEALASFDELVAQISGAVLGGGSWAGAAVGTPHEPEHHRAK